MTMPFHLNLADGRFGSIRLMFVSWWFKVGGIIFAVVTLTMLVATLVSSVSDGPRPEPLAIVIVGAMTIALLAAGRMLAHHQRRGAVLGLLLTLQPFCLPPFTSAAIDPVDIAISAVTVILLISVWGELSWGRGQVTRTTA
jgi:hypothetical protein